MPNIEVKGDRLVAKITIRGSIEAVWRELTKNNEPQAAVFNAWLHAQSFMPGARLQMRTGDGRNVLVVGNVVDFEPPRRFAHTEGVEVSLIVDNLPSGTRTAKEMHGGARMILETLKAVVEDGRPKFGTRVMYWMFGKMGFVLPARTRVEHWPL